MGAGQSEGLRSICVNALDEGRSASFAIGAASVPASGGTPYGKSIT